MKKFIAWLILSSKDPQKVSLTVKGFLGAAATYVVFFTGLFHLNITADNVTTLTDSLVYFVKVFLELVSVITTIVGAIRKLHTTAIGTNRVINTGKTL